MAINRGKQFELKARENLKMSFPHGYLYRIPDQLSGFKGAA